jgi:ComF family protein
LCGACNGLLTEIEMRGACERCARPLGQWGAPCPYCMGKGLRPFDQVVALGVFSDPLKHLIHRMKYHRRWGVGEELALRLLDHKRVTELLGDAECIVPVPLHRWRQMGRGYNQADVIARQLVTGRKIKVVHPLRRVRNTPSQTGMHAQQDRFENVKGAFELRVRAAGKIKGKRVVVVDDVMTTGATLQAVGRALKKAEPALLSAIVLAVADPRHRGFEAI